MAVLDLCKYPSTSIFQPFSSVIVSITRASPAVVTTLVPHQLINGTIVRLTISPNCGMPQINGQTATITVIDATSLSVPIDTRTYQPFVIPEDPDNPGFPYPNQQPCSFVIPIGEITSQLSAAEQNILPFNGQP